MNRLAYLLYGNGPAYHLELTYSVASALHHSRAAGGEPFEIVLICDEASVRPDLPIRQEVISAATLSEWTRGGKYNHEAKLHAMKLALSMGGERTVLIDTDTYLAASTQRLFDPIAPGRSLMQADEGLVRLNDAWLDHIAALGDSVGGYPIEPETRMSNSGVIGLHRDDAALVDAARQLMHDIDARVNVFNAEQFAVTLALRRKTTLQHCGPEVGHYWGWTRSLIHAQIGQLYPQRSSAAFAELVRTLPGVGFPPKRPIDQLHARLSALVGRHSPDYRFAHVAYLSALANRRRDRIVATGWAEVALNVLTKARVPPAKAKRLFHKVGTAASSEWLSTPVQERWANYWKG